MFNLFNLRCKKKYLRLNFSNTIKCILNESDTTIHCLIKLFFFSLYIILLVCDKNILFSEELANPKKVL